MLLYGNTAGDEGEFGMIRQREERRRDKSNTRLSWWNEIELLQGMWKR
jgi:hypothetical protein